MNTSKKGNIIFGLILVAYAIYAAVFIFKSSFIIGGERYFVLFDDAMISMRFAKNLVNGYGLVWNPGETPVEGFTNPLWTIWMAALHLLPVATSKVSLLVQVSGAVFMLGTLIFVRKISLDLANNELVSLLAVILTAFYMPLNNWALLGMEVSLLVLLISASTYLFLQNLRTDRFSFWPYLLLGLGTLVRFDMTVPFLVSMIFMVIADSKNRRRHLLWGLTTLLITLGGQTMLRWSYYHDLLPNTYYLKVTGYPMTLRIARGLYALFTFTWSSNWLLILLPLTLLLFRRDRPVILLFVLVLGQAAYSVYVGGDAWEHRGGANRYLALAIPSYFILFSYTAYQLKEFLANKLKDEAEIGSRRNRRITRWSNVVLVLLITLSMINFNFLLGKNRSMVRWLLLDQPMFSENNIDYVIISKAIEKITTPEARIAVVAAGITPYFSGRPAIDLLGKSDRRIAHEKAHNVGGWLSLEDFRPGHTKWDYEYTIGEIKPDLIVQLWGDTRPAEPYLEQDYVIGGSGDGPFFYLRRNSPNILWDQVVLSPETVP